MRLMIWIATLVALSFLVQAFSAGIKCEINESRVTDKFCYLGKCYDVETVSESGGDVKKNVILSKGEMIFISKLGEDYIGYHSDENITLNIDSIFGYLCVQDVSDIITEIEYAEDGFLAEPYTEEREKELKDLDAKEYFLCRGIDHEVVGNWIVINNWKKRCYKDDLLLYGAALAVLIILSVIFFRNR